MPLRSSTDTDTVASVRITHSRREPLKASDIQYFIDISAENAKKLARNPHWRPGCDDDDFLSDDEAPEQQPFVIDKKIVDGFPAPPSLHAYSSRRTHYTLSPEEDLLPPNPALTHRKYRDHANQLTVDIALDRQRRAQLRQPTLERSPSGASYSHPTRNAYPGLQHRERSSSRSNTYPPSSQKPMYNGRFGMSTQSLNEYIREGPACHRPNIHQQSNGSLHRAYKAEQNLSQWSVHPEQGMMPLASDFINPRRPPTPTHLTQRSYEQASYRRRPQPAYMHGRSQTNQARI
jgi:hypothetical protein